MRFVTRSICCFGVSVVLFCCTQYLLLLVFSLVTRHIGSKLLGTGVKSKYYHTTIQMFRLARVRKRVGIENSSFIQTHMVLSALNHDILLARFLPFFNGHVILGVVISVINMNVGVSSPRATQFWSKLQPELLECELQNIVTESQYYDYVSLSHMFMSFSTLLVFMKKDGLQRVGVQCPHSVKTQPTIRSYLEKDGC